MRLTENFYLHEFERSQTAERRGIDNRAPKDVIERIRIGCESVMQPIRDELGRVDLSSGYRCKALNKKIGGSTRSQHCIGEAADFGVEGMTDYEVCEWIMNSYLPFDQLIYEFGRWVHVSWVGDGRREPRRQVLSCYWDKDKGRTVYLAGLHEV